MVSVRRVAPVLLLAVTLAIPALAADAKKKPSSSNRPPKELHLVGNHWTPYLPPDPATYPPNAKTHTVKAGDTLWGLAKEYYGNGYLWPQLWEANTWVTDAHWIYPGDVLLVTGETSQAAVTTQTTTESSTLSGGQTAQEQPAQPPMITAAEVRHEAPPVPIATEADVYCYGYIGDPAEPMPNYISGFEDTELLSDPGMNSSITVSTGDLVYVAGGTSTGLVAGETYMLVEAGQMVPHPRTAAPIGREYHYQGQIKILCAEETSSRAIITQSCREVRIGTRLKPMPQIPIPIGRIPDIPAFCDPPTGRATGYIVSSADWDLGLATGNLVQVNIGRDDQIQPGDFLTVYRDFPGQPRQAVGEIGVLTTEGRTATGRIVAARRAIQVGDSVEAR